MLDAIATILFRFKIRFKLTQPIILDRFPAQHTIELRHCNVAIKVCRSMHASHPTRCFSDGFTQRWRQLFQVAAKHASAVLVAASNGAAGTPPMGVHALVWEGGWSRDEAARAIACSAKAGYDLVEGAATHGLLLHMGVLAGTAI